MNKIAAVIAAGAATLALIGVPVAHADPNNLDFSDYYKDLRRHGILVDGNEKYLADLAMIVCNLRNAGYPDSDIGDYIARRESIPNIKGYDIFLEADIDVCTQLHPVLVPPSPPYQAPPTVPSPPVVHLPPGYRDGD